VGNAGRRTFSRANCESGNENLETLGRPVPEGQVASRGSARRWALLQVQLESFSDGTTGAAPSDYGALHRADGYTFQNRSVDDYLR